MNVLHMKYAVEVARLGSLNKAAETLLIAQPNLSRSVKELEAELGITIFTRSAKGMVLTPDGEEFIGYANEILKQIDQVDKIYKEGAPKKQRFSISVPRASYISEAFTQFSKTLSTDSAEIFYKETNSQRTIHNILNHDYKLGIVRYAENYDKYFKLMLEEKGLAYEMVTEFSYCLVMSKESPLAQKDDIKFDDLKDYIEIAHADPYVPSLSLSKVVKEELPDNISRRIFIFERASQFDLLSDNSQTFMWVSPLPKKILERYNLVQKKCQENKKLYKDVLIYREGYKLSKIDKQFITALCEAKRKYII
ncbi:MAG: LysR family transcriptional regulator [Clostridia bacterium]|nr:LysR family transcriptional regulator [Clostridia bacterium]MBQ8146387.1 LysR family transcriptional regulator [Clostridia bacterium]